MSTTPANISTFMRPLNLTNRASFHQWTVEHPMDFWQKVVEKLNIHFDMPYTAIADLSQGVQSIQWFPGATLNIINSCFNAPRDQIAILYQDHLKNIATFSFGKLADLSNQIANSLINQGFVAGDAIAIAMPMNHYAVAIYLGIIKMGGIVVSIADSFSSQEIAVRLTIAKAKGIFTQDNIVWGGKQFPLYEKICQANAPKSIVLPLQATLLLPLRKEDVAWRDFLVDNKQFEAVACEPMSACTILFSSGTTGDPKAIPWNHTTPIKAASDAFFHQNIQAHDILTWPTNLGWMMGPWLIFAAFINQAAIALYPDVPKNRAFGEFVEKAKVTMLGVVPTLVSAWRQSRCMEGLDWEKIKVLTSTGECSNADDMRYLSSLAGSKPIIEYCGGTEIGGAYISSTVIDENYPALFSTPAMGIDFVILDETGSLSDEGEVAIIPPSIGLSTTLLNADHDAIYYHNMPTFNGKLLRRHGDQLKRLPNGYFSILGRADDTMNLGGIKVSAAEIERAIIGMPDVNEVAAIAITPPGNGPSQLVIYATLAQENIDKNTLTKKIQKRINTALNPLFKIHDIVFVNELPKTASNKIMRRILRKTYHPV